jgi:hypothetical protein
VVIEQLNGISTLIERIQHALDFSIAPVSLLISCMVLVVSA